MDGSQKCFSKPPPSEQLPPVKITSCNATSGSSACAQAFDGNPGTAWTTTGTAVGAWIKLGFARSERISAVDFASLPNSALSKEVRLEFSNNASAAVVTLANSPSSQRVHIASVTTAWVRATVLSTHATYSAGTSAPVASVAYEYGAKNSLACPSGTERIVDRAVCKAAAEAMGRTMKDLDQLRTYPSGCWRLSSTFYFNTVANGNANSASEVICTPVNTPAPHTPNVAGAMQINFTPEHSDVANNGFTCRYVSPLGVAVPS